MKPRIAVVGMSLEASVFSPARTREADFVRRDGQQILEEYAFLRPEHRVGAAAHWIPLVHYRALPGGAVPVADFEHMCTQILTALSDEIARGGALDGVLLDLHGAMSVVHDDGAPLLDPEGDLAERVRAVVGVDALLSSGMDLHGNMSWRLAHCLDLLTCYRQAPHEDWLETKERSARNLVEQLGKPVGERRPVKALVAVPILLPGEMTSTRIEPAKSLYAMVERVEAQPGILDAGIWIGYPWADEPRNHAAVVVTGEAWADPGGHASRIATAMWEAREHFEFVAPAGTLDECLDAAVRSGARPYFVSDSGDNPTAGGAGDVTWSLERLLQRPELSGALRAVYASIPDAGAAAACVQAGVGASVTLAVGARVDGRHSGPVELVGTVVHVAHGDPVARTEVVVRVGSLDVLVTERRKPYHLRADFERNGIELDAVDLVVVKIGYLEPELYDAAADWMLALTPGGVDQDLARLGYCHIRRPMFPLDRAMPTPPLHATIVPASDDGVSEEVSEKVGEKLGEGRDLAGA